MAEPKETPLLLYPAKPGSRVKAPLMEPINLTHKITKFIPEKKYIVSISEPSGEEALIPNISIIMQSDLPGSSMMVKLVGLYKKLRSTIGHGFTWHDDLISEDQQILKREPRTHGRGAVITI